MGLVPELLKSASFQGIGFIWYFFAFIVLPSLRMAEYVDPYENYPLPQRLNFFYGSLSPRAFTPLFLLVRGHLPVASAASINCHHLFKLKMLFITPQFVEGLRFDFFFFKQTLS